MFSVFNPASAEVPAVAGDLDEGPHGEQVGQHGGEALSQAALSNEAELQLSKTNCVVPLLPGPAWDVEEVSLKGGKGEGRDFQRNCQKKMLEIKILLIVAGNLNWAI